MPNVKPIPDSYRAITPNLVCNNAAAAIDFYKQVFGATETSRMPGPDGKVAHAELKIGDSAFFVNDHMHGQLAPPPGPDIFNPISLHLYVNSVDDIFKRATAAGARADMPPQDMFWGDRYARITDPFGQQWGIATHIEDVAPEDIPRRQQEFFARAAAGRR